MYSVNNTYGVFPALPRNPAVQHRTSGPVPPYNTVQCARLSRVVSWLSSNGEAGEHAQGATKLLKKLSSTYYKKSNVDSKVDLAEKMHFKTLTCFGSIDIYENFKPRHVKSNKKSREEWRNRRSLIETYTSPILQPDRTYLHSRDQIINQTAFKNSFHPIFMNKNPLHGIQPTF